MNIINQLSKAKRIANTAKETVEKFLHHLEEGEAVWGFSVAKIDCSAETLFAYLWLLDTNVRQSEHKRFKEIRKVFKNIDCTRGLQYSRSMKLPGGLIDRLFEVWITWDIVVNPDGRKTYIVAITPLKEYKGTHHKVDGAEKMQDATSKGVYVVKEISSHTCEWTRAQQIDLKLPSFPTRLLNFLAKQHLKWADEVQTMYMRNPKEVDLERTAVLAGVIRARRNVKLMEDQTAIFQSSMEMLGAPNSTGWTKIDSPTHEVEMKMQYFPPKKGERSIVTGKAVGVIDCSSEEAAAWVMDYCSIERTRMSTDEGNPGRFELRGKARVNESTVATVKKMPFLLDNREVVARLIWKSEEGKVLIAFDSVNDQVDYGAELRKIRGLTRGMWQIEDLSQRGVVKQCHVTLVQRFDAGGFLPKWVVNMKVPAILNLQEMINAFRQDEKVDAADRRTFLTFLREKWEEEVYSVKENAFLKRVREKLELSFGTAGIWRELQSPDVFVYMDTRLGEAQKRVDTSIGRATTTVDATIEECAAWELTRQTRSRIKAHFDLGGLDRKEFVTNSKNVSMLSHLSNMRKMFDRSARVDAGRREALAPVFRKIPAGESSEQAAAQFEALYKERKGWEPPSRGFGMAESMVLTAGKISCRGWGRTSVKVRAEMEAVAAFFWDFGSRINMEISDDVERTFEEEEHIFDFKKILATMGVNQWRVQNRAVKELMEKYEWFEPMTVVLGKGIVKVAPWGLMARVIVGAVLSVSDLFSDVVVLITFWTSTDNDSNFYRNLMIICLALSIFLQLAVVVGVQNCKKGFKFILKESLIVLVGLKAPWDAFRVASGGEKLKDTEFEPMMEMTISKLIEVFTESIPGICIQTSAILNALQKGAKVDGGLIISLLVSVLTTGFVSSSISYDFDVDPLNRAHLPSFYGYVPDSAPKRILIFITQILISAVQVLLKSLLVVELGEWASVYLGVELAIFVLVKLVRRDLTYWMPIYGKRGVFVALNVRVLVKVIADFTACFQLRHPNEVGGLYFTVNLFLPLIMLALLLYFRDEGGTAEARLTFMKNMALALGISLVCLLGVFFALIEKQFLKTFFNTDSGVTFACKKFIKGEDLEKSDVVLSHINHWAPIADLIEEWISMNWYLWEDEPPQWFTESWRSSVPEHMKPGRRLEQQMTVSSSNINPIGHGISNVGSGKSATRVERDQNRMSINGSTKLANLIMEKQLLNLPTTRHNAKVKPVAGGGGEGGGGDGGGGAKRRRRVTKLRFNEEVFKEEIVLTSMRGVKM
ncbi:hypothetical protein TrLO_g14860 [Triparma laevis f. longispina]|uniref:Uncharacterized protein n=1 Tax=Triparma laevis f. longispina TaxID=1714387 RepID=A0A9W7FV49_9STRA|nr:hypothetical protein TrLO_g14860 [Triparma laevis f. longispina]